MSIVNIVYVIALIIVVAMIYSKLKSHSEVEVKEAFFKGWAKGMQDAIDYIELMSDNTQEEADAIKEQMMVDIRNKEDK